MGAAEQAEQLLVDIVRRIFHTIVTKHVTVMAASVFVGCALSPAGAEIVAANDFVIVEALKTVSPGLLHHEAVIRQNKLGDGVPVDGGPGGGEIEGVFPLAHQLTQPAVEAELEVWVNRADFLQVPAQILEADPGQLGLALAQIAPEHVPSVRLERHGIVPAAGGEGHAPHQVDGSLDDAIHRLRVEVVKHDEAKVRVLGLGVFPPGQSRGRGAPTLHVLLIELVGNVPGDEGDLFRIVPVQVPSLAARAVPLEIKRRSDALRCQPLRPRLLTGDGFDLSRVARGEGLVRFFVDQARGIVRSGRPKLAVVGYVGLGCIGMMPAVAFLLSGGIRPVDEHCVVAGVNREPGPGRRDHLACDHGLDQHRLAPKRVLRRHGPFHSLAVVSALSQAHRSRRQFRAAAQSVPNTDAQFGVLFGARAVVQINREALGLAGTAPGVLRGQFPHRHRRLAKLLDAELLDEEPPQGGIRRRVPAVPADSGPLRGQGDRNDQGFSARDAADAVHSPDQLFQPPVGVRGHGQQAARVLLDALAQCGQVRRALGCHVAEYRGQEAIHLVGLEVQALQQRRVQVEIEMELLCPVLGGKIGGVEDAGSDDSADFGRPHGQVDAVANGMKQTSHAKSRRDPVGAVRQVLQRIGTADRLSLCATARLSLCTSARDSVPADLHFEGGRHSILLFLNEREVAVVAVILKLAGREACHRLTGLARM